MAPVTFMRASLVVSILAHAAALLALRPLAGHLARATTAPVDDRWTGSSIEVSLAGPGEGASEGDPQSTTPQSTTPQVPSPGADKAPATNSAPPGDSAPLPSAPADSAPATTHQATQTPSAAGIGVAAAPPKAKAPRKASSKKRAADKASSDKAPSDKPSRPIKPLRFGKMPKPSSAAGSAGPVASAAPSSAPAGSAGPGSGPGGTFGSEGAAAVRDLGRAFTRAIPAACSADPVWGTVAVGDTLAMSARVHVDATGHVTSAEPAAEDAPKALVSLLKRTLPMLQGGTFAVQGGAVTAGTETLELRATVRAEAPESDTRDDLAFSYSSGRGKASFAGAGGHHVDVAVRVLGVEAAP